MSGRVMVPKGPRAAEMRAREWLTRPNHPPLPDWLQLRDIQLDAVERVTKEYEAGCKVVFLDAPTGTGKTSIADLMARRLDVARMLYVCTTKSLQEQVARDFAYARVLKGRANYTPTNLMSREASGYRAGFGGATIGGVTCRDCDAGPAGVDESEQSCSYCSAVEDCPYRVARREAGVAPMGVLNTAFLLAHLNGGGGRKSPFGGRELVVADECDLLEDELLGYVELRLGQGYVDQMGLEVPKKGSHMTTIRGWLREDVSPGLVALAKATGTRDLEARRKRRRVEQMIEDVARVLDREDGWVRDGDEEGARTGNGLVLKPVSVEDVGDRYLWQHAERWLCMSGTIVSAETMAESLGLEEAGIEWGVVEMPMLFPVENRRVKYVPVATMTRKGLEADEGGVDRVMDAVWQVVTRHEGENVLVHTHTYKLADQVTGYLRAKGVTAIEYKGARDREDALARFRSEGGVLVAPSMDRGVDLPGDLCRVQVIVKVPMASLGSRQVSERLRQPGGDAWYLANTVRSLMQMTGRAVRGMDDWAVCYVLDAHFGKVLGDGKRRGMWPQWWLDGLELGRLT